MNSMLNEKATARATTIQLLKDTVDEKNWIENSLTINNIRNEINNHQLFNHNIISSLNNGEFDLEKIQKIHLEYKNAIVEIFTDALLAAQWSAKELDQLFEPTVKMYARFLLSFNISDEFGLVANTNYEISPLNSHFCLYRNVLEQLNISEEMIKTYKHSEESSILRATLENSYTSYCDIVLLLAIAEMQVIKFSAPLKKSLSHLNIDTNYGYYNVHGTTIDADLNAADDEHEDDLWILLNQVSHFSQPDKIKAKALEYCDSWNKFWSKMNDI
ncbi:MULTISPECIES: hypothetical protein [Acinetobacter]|uniref:hypothetical protein n=1 Tax=Acinetobacter TaxID=469 RepID=UPI0002CF0C12|nr:MULTISPECIES: hypothetical protein [Acinetobacter]ENX32962.1 hypothetical protein F890_00120 [Acinetobacter sp. CIP 64.7]MCU4324866.1 hypothetical protein [Acinetobacter schindleri]